MGDISADACVIGGGPAGSTTARQLAVLGYEVCLIERATDARGKIGASLPPGVTTQLDIIGARERVEGAGFLRPQRIIAWWSQAHPAPRPLPGPPGFHVERSVFDALLLENARESGVTVLHGEALRPQRLSGGWRVGVRHAGRRRDVSARFLIDASGGLTLLPGRRIRVAPPLIGLFAYWRMPDATSEARVEAGAQEWFWYAPLGRDKSVAAAFVDPKRLSGVPPEDVATVYYDLLRSFRLFRDLPAGRIMGGVTACDASSRYAAEAAGADFVRVGDANFTVDPLSSQGIQSALASGIQAAIVVNTLAKHPAHADAAIAFYRERQTEKVMQHAATAAAYYGERAAVCDRSFWRKRTASGIASAPALETQALDPACPIRLCEQARIEDTPTIRGDMIASTPALRHAALERPVAFLDGIELAPLLGRIRAGTTADATVQAWSDLPAERGWRVLHWLWQRRIVVPCSPA